MILLKRLFYIIVVLLLCTIKPRWTRNIFFIPRCYSHYVYNNRSDCFILNRCLNSSLIVFESIVSILLLLMKDNKIIWNRESNRTVIILFNDVPSHFYQALAPETIQLANVFYFEFQTWVLYYRFSAVNSSTKIHQQRLPRLLWQFYGRRREH